MVFAQMIRRYDGPELTTMRDHDHWIGAVVTLLIVLILAGVAIYLIRAFAQNNASQTDVRDPLDYAKERYAKGEITKEELADIKKELK
jgi:uncharacterized membrane protein